MTSKKRPEEQLKQLIADNYEGLVEILMTKARHYGFLKKVYAEDIAQSAFEHLLKQIDRGNLNWVLDESQPDTMLKRILLTISFRGAVVKVTETAQAYRFSPFNYSEYSEDLLTSSVLEEALEKLPAKSRELIEMFYIKGYGIKEIAHKLERSSDAVKQELHRIRKKLREILLSMDT